MKPAFLALAALGAAAAAAPALAQGYGYQGNNDRYYNGNRGAYQDDRAQANMSLDTRVARLEQRLNAGVAAGTIDREEAASLRAELRDIRRMNRQYGYGGVSASERADLVARLQGLRDDIAAAEGGSGYSYNQEGYGPPGNGAYANGYGRGDDRGSGSYVGTYGNGYGSSYSSSGNGYGSYSRSGNGSYGTPTNSYGGSYSASTNGAYGRGGGYGDEEGYATLQVGDRAPGNLYGVPNNLRNTYRDGYGYYYRSDGQAVYQIDTRTNVVQRVYPMNR